MKTIQITYSFINSGNFTTMQMRNFHGNVFFLKNDLWHTIALKTYLNTSPYINLMKVFIHVIAIHFKGIRSHLNTYISFLSLFLVYPVKEFKTTSTKIAIKYSTKNIQSSTQKHFIPIKMNC